jgi:alpha-1,2-mannosyltransferase
LATPLVGEGEEDAKDAQRMSESALEAGRPVGWAAVVAKAQGADALRAVLLLWGVVGLAVSVRTLVRPDTHTVFPIYSAGAQRWWDDTPLYIRADGLDDFRYPPPFAVAVTPFTALGTRAGGVLWGWVSLGVYLAGLWGFSRDVLGWAGRRGRLAGLLALGLAGALRGLWNAQANALVVGLLLLGVSALVRRRWWRGSFLLAGGVWVKLTPLAVGLLLCALWPRRLAPRLALALGVLALVPLVSRPPGVVLGRYMEWVGHMRQTGKERWPGFRDAWTAWSAARHMMEGREGPLPLKADLDSPGYRAVQLVTAAGALGWCLWQRRRGLGGEALGVRALAMGCAWLLLFGPATEHSTYVFLAPALAWGMLRDEGRGRWLVVTAGVLILVLGWGALTRPWAEACPLVYAILPAGTALFVVWLVGWAGGRIPVSRDAQRSALLPPAPLRVAAKPFSG